MLARHCHTQAFVTVQVDPVNRRKLVVYLLNLESHIFEVLFRE